MRNRSLTKEEVAAFLRQHKKPVPEHNANGGLTVVTSPPLASSPRVRTDFGK